jgi:hypothetical protein
MMWFALVLILAIASQVGLFLYSRKIKKGLKDSVIEKYNLRTPKDAWEALGNPEIPDEDKNEIQKLYDGDQ